MSNPQLSTRLRVFLTGAAGFVGSYVAARLLDEGDEVVGLDSFDATVYPADLKRARAARLLRRARFSLHEAALEAAGLSYLAVGQGDGARAEQ